MTRAAVPPTDAIPRSLSVSAQMNERFARRKTWRRFVAFVYIVVLTSYLAWRWTVINPESLALSIAYYVAECIGFILGLKMIFNAWSYSHRVPPDAPQGLSVDVFLPVYKEPVEIIRRTVMAAKAIRYPHRTVMLDDGKRGELEALAAELGIDYLRRPDNAGAKAGNLNYGLRHSTADYVMVLDADHIALPHALDVMLGFFGDDKVAMVQTPQDYYNIDAFQYVNAPNGALWHDQSAFYNLSQPGADAVNAAECVGTGVVYRRAALDSIGGIPTGTVTEDTHTSLRLHKAGLKTVYINEPVAYGLAAADLSEYYKTRHRWGHGNLQVLRAEKVLTCKGLTLPQRLHYGLMGVIYLEGWQQLLLLSLPVLTLIFGMQSFTVTIFNVMIIMAFPFVSYMLLQEMGCGFARYWANEIFSMARWPVYIAACAGAFGGKMRFNSSVKSARGAVSWRLMAPQAAVLAASIFAIAYGFGRLMETGFQTGPLVRALMGMTERIDLHAVVPPGYTVDLFVISAGWALYGAARAGLFIRKAVRGAAQSHDFFRFAVPVPVEAADGRQGCITQLAEDWAEMRLEGGAAVGAVLSFTAFLPAGPQPLVLRVASVTGEVVSGDLVWDSTAARDALAASLYSVDWHREFLNRNAYFMAPSDLLCGLLQPRAARQVWHAALLADADGKYVNYGLLSEPEKAGAEGSLIAFMPLREGDTCAARIFRPGGWVEARLHLGAEEGIHSLTREGLDGAVPRRYCASVLN